MTHSTLSPLPMSHVIWRCARLSLLAAACGACVPASQRELRAALAPEALRPDSVVVRVASRYDRPLTIRLVREGVDTVLGDVSAGGTARFPMRAADVTGTGFALAVNPTASNERMRTADLTVQRGQIVRLEVGRKLAESRVVIGWPPRCETCSNPLRSP